MDDQEQRLEDDQNDVLAKALSHYGIHPPQGITPQNCDDSLLLEIGLDPESFRSMPASIPAIELPPGVRRHISPFANWTVNIWTIQTPSGLIAIDTGCAPCDLAKATNWITPNAILITHNDYDHTGGIAAFPTAALYGPDTLKAGDTLVTGSLEWRIHDMRGHTVTGLGFETSVGGHSLFFPGDSIFARSLGKSRQPFAVTIANILAAIESLPDKTIICPGHGPATTVSQEKSHNPFLARHFR